MPRKPSRVTTTPVHPVLVAVRAALGAGPVTAGPPPDPWHAWLLVALARQVDRQRWLVRVQRERLSRASRRGDVPGMPGWKFYFHGIGLCLTAPDGETIDVDDHGDDGLTIDPWFFTQRMLTSPMSRSSTRSTNVAPGPTRSDQGSIRTSTAWCGDEMQVVGNSPIQPE
ncbi:DUF6896 domain-containing protein [Sorangium sp. So ce117]|uniref:DUF6896 domain-containing protein n=1 Tax=Sorangium sp. So ce117 TaxID=3133277 RepID=UPI003F628B7F